MAPRLKELPGLESAERFSGEQVPADPRQIEQIKILAELIKQHHDAVEERIPDSYWLGDFVFDLSDSDVHDLRIIASPPKDGDWTQLNLLQPNQIIVSGDKASFNDGPNTLLSSSGADNIIDYIKPRLEIMGAFEEEFEDIASEAGKIAVAGN